jgi:hypothetical protein
MYYRIIKSKCIAFRSFKWLTEMYIIVVFSMTFTFNVDLDSICNQIMINDVPIEAMKLMFMCRHLALHYSKFDNDDFRTKRGSFRYN